MIFDVESADFQEGTKSASALDIPEHVPHRLYVGQVAKVLGLPEYRVDYQTRRGKLPLLNEAWRDHGEWREYSPEAVARYAESRGIVPNWRAL